MQLSPEREAELFAQNMPMIRKVVGSFMARRSRNAPIRIDRDDFISEVSENYLRYIRKCETEEELAKFPWKDSENVMARYVLASQHITVPSGSTRLFSKLIGELPETVSYELLTDDGIGVDGMSMRWVSDAETEVDLEAFLATRSEAMRNVVNMYMHGVAMSDIADELGCTRQNVYKIMDKFAKEYKKFRKG
jgi:DNA-directed RNA polymerase specialized sigma24 family protein